MPILGTLAQYGDLTSRILAMDPGSDTVGLAFLRAVPGDFRVYLDDTVFLNANRFAPKDSHVRSMYGDRAARIDWLCGAFSFYLEHFQPDVFIAEAPYMGRFAQAFEALVEARTHFKRTLEQYDPTMPYNFIEPKTVKARMGAVDSSKPAMRDAVLRNPDIVWAPHIDREALTEHEYDAIAVGYYYITEYAR